MSTSATPDDCSLALGDACEWQGRCTEQGGAVIHQANYLTQSGTRVSHYSARWGNREGVIKVCRGDGRGGVPFFSVQWDDGSWSDSVARLTVLAAPDYS